MKRPTLRKGERGRDVEYLQHRLIAHGYSLAPFGADGDFGDLTDKLVKQFQQQHGLVADGVAGDNTWEQLDKEEAKHPPEPNFAPLRGNAGRAAVFGKFAYQPSPVSGNPEAIRYTDDWPDRNILTVTVPQIAAIKGVRHRGKLVGYGPKTGRLSVHRLIAEQLKAMWQAWDDAGLLHHVLTWAGMWNPRFIRGSRSVLSNHAFATAFDINAPWNGLGAVPAAYGAKGSVRELVPIAHAHGFYWGGHFNRRPDGMHFEAAQVL